MYLFDVLFYYKDRRLIVVKKLIKYICVLKLEFYKIVAIYNHGVNTHNQIPALIRKITLDDTFKNI